MKRKSADQEVILKHKRMAHSALVMMFDVIVVSCSYIIGLLVRYEFLFEQIPREYVYNLEFVLPVFVVVTVGVYYLAHLYSFMWRYISVTEGCRIAAAAAVVTLINCGISFAINLRLPYSAHFVALILNIFGALAIRYSYRFVKAVFKITEDMRYPDKKQSVLLIGAGAAGQSLIKSLNSRNNCEYKIKCIIDDNISLHGKYVGEAPIVGGKESILECAEKYNIDLIIYAIPSAPSTVKRDYLSICNMTGCKLRIIPSFYRLVNGDITVNNLRDVKIEDLLGRDTVKVNLSEIMGYVENKVILVTGGGGSIGSELCRQISAHLPKQLIILDIYENNAYDIQQELKRRYPSLDLVVLIGSVRDEKRVDMIFKQYKPEIVYHAAAHKHVPLMECSPNEVIKNNVFGTYKVAKCASKHGTEKFVLISTDKAVNPTNIMGASKRLCEMVVQSMDRSSETEFVAVRFGNVLGSNGSVIPLFKNQIAEGGPVTVTHPEIIRYFMTIPEAVSLVLQAGAYAKGGEIFVLDMGEPVKIADLAKNLIRLSGYTPDVDMKIQYTGLRPGEKLYEELLMKEEGLIETDNKLIYIGQPIEMDDEQFVKNLEVLYEKCNDNVDNIKEIVQKLVPTYKRQ